MSEDAHVQPDAIWSEMQQLYKRRTDARDTLNLARLLVG
jgi:hypothetical protein